MSEFQYKKLAKHNSVCNEVFYILQDCLREHPFAKFVGKCTKLEKDLSHCIRENREDMRSKNKSKIKEK